jgi:hypothetical protein
MTILVDFCVAIGEIIVMETGRGTYSRLFPTWKFAKLSIWARLDRHSAYHDHSNQF